MENFASAPKSVNIITTGSKYMYTMKYITKLYDTFRTDDFFITFVCIVLAEKDESHGDVGDYQNETTARGVLKICYLSL